jgi:hypothetical protein
MSAARPRSLRAQATAALVALAVAPVLLVGAGVLAVSLRHFQREVDVRTERLAGAVAGEVETFLVSQRVHMQEVALGLERALPRGAPEVDELLALHRRANRHVDGLLVIDAAGRVVHASPPDPDLVGVDLSGQPSCARPAPPRRRRGRRRPSRSAPASRASRSWSRRATTLRWATSTCTGSAGWSSGRARRPGWSPCWTTTGP